MYSFSTRDINRLVDNLERAAGRRARSEFFRLMLDVRRRMRTRATRDISDEYTLIQRIIRENLRFSNVDRSRLEFTISGLPTPIGLYRFRARQTKKGVTFQIRKQGGRKLMKSAFRNTASSIGPNVFQRKRLAGGGRAGRLPIEKVSGPSVSNMLKKKERLRRLSDFASKNMAQNAARRLTRLLKKG